jgi:hypothetical protein
LAAFLKDEPGEVLRVGSCRKGRPKSRTECSETLGQSFCCLNLVQGFGEGFRSEVETLGAAMWLMLWTSIRQISTPASRGWGRRIGAGGLRGVPFEQQQSDVNRKQERSR